MQMVKNTPWNSKDLLNDTARVNGGLRLRLDKVNFIAVKLIAKT